MTLSFSKLDSHTAICLWKVLMTHIACGVLPAAVAPALCSRACVMLIDALAGDKQTPANAVGCKSR